MNRKQIEYYFNTIFELRNKLYLAKSEEKALPIFYELKKLLESQPKRLYKYSSLSEYTFDAIENGYIYVCAADKLDDQFECCVNEPFREKTKNKKQIDDRFAKQLSKMVQEMQETLDDDSVKAIVLGCVKRLSIIDENYFKKSENRSLITLLTKNNKRNILPLTYKKGHYRKLTCSNDRNESERFRKKLPDLVLETWSKTKKNDITEKMINRAYKMQKNTGIGSLTECSKSQVMWEMYADHYKGVCIEYDMSSEKAKGAVFPVLYGNKNQTDLVSLLIKTHLESFLFNISNGKINSVESERRYMTKLLLTKYKEWSFQKEWRIIGKPGDKFQPAVIKRILIGKNISEANKAKLLKIAKEKKIDLYMQLDNYESLEIKYEKIL